VAAASGLEATVAKSGIAPTPGSGSIGGPSSMTCRISPMRSRRKVRQGFLYLPKLRVGTTRVPQRISCFQLRAVGERNPNDEVVDGTPRPSAIGVPLGMVMYGCSDSSGILPKPHSRRRAVPWLAISDQLGMVDTKRAGQPCAMDCVWY
jgi:hypothetical protein